MEILTAFLLCIAVCMVLAALLEKKRTDVTEIYIPTDTDTEQTVREKLYESSLRGSKIIICRTAADKEEILKRMTEEYGKIYKKR
ncbi:MAG: hypothetical protein IKC06_05100 [Clostridia bacterium]|nr:hypothetical protein [Clostridia bacterium]